MVRALIQESGYMLKIIVKLYFKIFKKGKIGEFYNIGSNKNLSNIEVCKNILKVSKKLIKQKIK